MAQSTPVRKIRAFYAIDPDPLTREHLVYTLHQLQLSTWAGQVKWVSADNLHLTLRFLGHVSEDTLNAVHKAVCLRFNQLSLNNLQLKLSPPVFFPHPRKPRIIALQVDADPHSQQQLLQIVQLIESASVENGINAEMREFKGHITLGRVRSRLPKNINLALPSPPTPMPVSELLLYQSELSIAGAQYTVLRRIAF